MNLIDFSNYREDKSLNYYRGLQRNFQCAHHCEQYFFLCEGIPKHPTKMDLVFV